MSQITLSMTDNGDFVSRKPFKPTRIYACSKCPKTFKRSEHRTRHERGHTLEKPFSCRYCDRSYARKDLISRHEKSFHPHADKPLPRPPVEEALPELHTENSGSKPGDSTTAAMHERTLPIPPVPNTSGPSPTPSRTILPDNSLEFGPALPPHDTRAHTRSRPSPTMSHTGPGSPSPDLTMSQTVRPSSAHAAQPPLHTAATTGSFQAPMIPAIIDRTAADYLSLNSEQSSTERTQVMNEQQNIPDINSWQIPDMMWRDDNSLRGEDYQANSSVLTQPNAAQDQQVDTDFDNIDILSMMPSNGIDFEADFSTYLFHSGYSPEERLENGGSIPADSPGQQPPTLSPNAAGPFPAGTRPVPNFEQGTFTRMPSVMKETPRKLPIPLIDLETYQLIVADIRNQLGSKRAEEMEILSLRDMQRFLTSYFTCFHRHCPIIHIQTLDLRTTPRHLILAICAIGALYRLSRKIAGDLWFWADSIVDRESPSTSSEVLSRDLTASAQCRMLLGMFSIFSGDLTERALSKAGYWCTEYRIRRSALTLTPYDPTTITYEQWVSRETSKRLLYGIFIMSSLTTVTYDLCPAFSVTQDLDIEILEAECLWEANTPEQWEALKKSQPPRTSITVRDAMTHLLFGREQPAVDAQPIKWTAFATAMVFHAVNVHMWSVMQCTQSLTTFSVDEQSSKILKFGVVSQVDTALARCYALLTADRSERDHTCDDPEGPLIFNCLALLRSAYVRVFTGAGNFNRMILLSEDSRQIASTIRAYVVSSQERSPFLTRAVGKAYGGLLTPIKAGHLLVRKTAALSWSVEHAIAAWDCALFVTKWIHVMEMQQQEIPPNDEELQNLLNFRKLLVEVDSDYNGTGSLAGEVARVWASFLDDTWVWGITPRMGRVLRQLSDAFISDWKENFPRENPTGPISR